MSEALNDKQMKVSKKIIRELYKLYFIQATKYLKQKQGGEYSTIKGYVSDAVLLDHLEGKYTIGTFAGVGYSKFIGFDIDYRDPSLAKWITYKIAHEIENIGVYDYHISFSGNKGYHLEIFVHDLIPNQTAHKFYEYIVSRAQIEEYDGKVEFRPTDGLGVKIPIGIHQVTGKFCGYCNIENELKMMTKRQSYNYLFQINKISNKIIYDILEKHTAISRSKLPKKKLILDTEEAISRHEPLPIHNPTEEFKIDEVIELLTNGLKFSGNRHTSVVKIAKYLRYMEIVKGEALEIVNEWMENQNSNYYNTPLDDCLKENKRIINWAYSKEISIKPPERYIAVTLEEVNAIVTQCPEKNQKLLMYSILIHSKRFARSDGIFFMTFQQMADSTGLGKATCKRQIEKMLKLGVIESVERKRRQKGSENYLPNKYKITLHIELNDNTTYNLYVTDKQNNFNECLAAYFDHNQLREMLPRRQYKSITSHT